MKPYIGVTGFTKVEEVEAAKELIPKMSGRRLMVGALASWKSLRGSVLSPIWQKRFADPSKLPDLFFYDEQLFNLVHYNTSKGMEHTIVEDLEKIKASMPTEQCCHGFQLNMPWPYEHVLTRFREHDGGRAFIVLQIGNRAVEYAGDTPSAVADRLKHYQNLVNAVLFDPSGGRGVLFDSDRAHSFLSAIASKGFGFQLGVAGGLGPDSLHLVEPLIKDFPDLNIDAEGKLRDENGDMNIEAMKLYLSRAFQMFN